MDVYYAIVVAAIVGTMALALARAWAGPTVFDRILGLNMFGTKTVLLIAVGSFFMGRPDFLDLALLYVLINFIGIVAVLRFARYRDFAGRGRNNRPAPDVTMSWE